MKKLVFVLLAGLVAVATQAATVSWGMSKVYSYGTDGSATSQRASGYISYLLVGDSTSGLTALAGQGATVISTYVTDNNIYGGSATTSSGSITVSKYGSYSEAKANVYAVVFDAATISDASHYYVTSVMSLSIPSGSADGSVAFGSQKDGTINTANWYSVASESTPEPTSGLLLMIGTAMLALRRRRA